MTVDRHDAFGNTHVDIELGPVVDLLLALVWCALPDGRPEFLNRRWREYTGLDLGQPSETTWRAAIHPDDLPQWLEHWRSVSTSSEPWELELRLRRFDGVYRWFLCRASPQTDASSQIVRWCGINTDIDDDRRRAESDLRTIETNFSGWVESFPGLMVTMNTAGEVKLFSQEVLEYFGKTREELRNWAMTDAVHPDDLQRVVAAFTESVTTGKPYSIDHRCRRADGVYRWFQVRALAVRDADEQITGWYVVLVDIDDVKRAEAELRRAHNSFADAQRLSKTGSFITDLVAEDHNWSEEAYRIFEFETESKVTVQRIRDIIHPDDLPSFDSVIARGMSGVNVDCAFRIVTARGAVKHVRGIAHVVEQVEGRPMFVGALQDVTESMVAEEALNKARSELAHVSRITTVSALTASIAHEVNQPLAAIITNASTCLRMLNRDPPNIDGARETIRRAARDGNRASEVIGRLRALFTKREFTLESVDLSQATREVLALSMSDLRRSRVILQAELADDVPPVTGDRVQLQQVILNLLRNASDAMADVHDRSRDLLVKTEREDGNRVRVIVRDAGVGLSSQSIDQLFDAFYTTKSGGMGIGLSVSRSIIETHHGRLWAAPNDGPGATFGFSIPVAPADPSRHSLGMAPLATAPMDDSRAAGLS